MVDQHCRNAVTYIGVAGHTYSFYSIARDFVGNVESEKADAEATTRVVGPDMPVAPMTPVSPVAPVKPTAPIAPVVPGTRSTPVAPMTPASPVAPVKATAPIAE